MHRLSSDRTAMLQSPAMPQSYLIFDLATDEEAARLARHKIDNWKQAFRLGAKLDIRFERTPADSTADPSSTTDPRNVGAGPSSRAESKDAPPSPGENTAAPGKGTTEKGKLTRGSSKEPPASEPAESPAPPETASDRIRLIVRLDFSDHEKLSHQRWLDRIPSEDPFKSLPSQTIRPSDPTHADTRSLFDSL